MKLNKALFQTAALTAILFACSTTKQVSQAPSPTLFSVNGQTITTEEFDYVFNKNRYLNDSLTTEKEIREYLDLFIKFKLKVAEAYDLGLQDTESYKSEFNTYYKQLAKPYLTENNVTDHLVKEAYERLKTEVNASHILLEIALDAEPADTLKVYQKINDIRNKALKGADFAKLAAEYSNDPSAKEMGGNLGYFTALQMVYSFEDAAFKTPVGEISPIIRTRYGFHVLKVHDKRPSRGKVKVSHIMVRATEGMSPEDSVAARAKAFEIFQNVKNGGNWKEACVQFSDDLNTRNKEGNLPMFGTGSMIAAFEEAAFSLQNPGDIGEPIKTPYGWHIIRLDEKQGLDTFEKMKPGLESKVSRDSRSEIHKSALLKRLKVENKLVEIPKTKDLALQQFDSTLLAGKWKIKVWEINSKPLFSISDQTYTVLNFFEYVITKQRAQVSKSVVFYAQTLYQNYLDESLIAYEEAHLEEKYPEYRMLVKEYREGILLFQLMEEKVWSRAVEDTAGLRNFYLQNLDKYQWQQRATAHIFNAASVEIINEINNLSDLKKVDLLALEKKYNQSSGLNLIAKTGSFERGENEFLDQVDWSLGRHTLQSSGRSVLIEIMEIKPSQAKKLEEIRGLVIADFQNYLEAQWVEELKKKYPVVINDAELNKMIANAK